MTAEEIAILELAFEAGKKIYDAVEAYRAGEIDAAATLAALGKTSDEIAAHNAKYQAELDAKFPTGAP